MACSRLVNSFFKVYNEFLVTLHLRQSLGVTFEHVSKNNHFLEEPFNYYLKNFERTAKVNK